jgi:hypothetical protein
MLVVGRHSQHQNAARLVVGLLDAADGGLGDA